MTKKIVFIIAGALTASCATPEIGEVSKVRCEMRSLKEIFSRPTDAIGQTFCGWVKAISESRAVKLFPAEDALPQDRTDILLLPNRSAKEELMKRIQTNGETIVYVEGIITAESKCFTDTEVSCLPYRRPLTIEVSRMVMR